MEEDTVHCCRDGYNGEHNMDYHPLFLALR